MRLRKFGHSCLLIEEGDARLLLDPGAFSTGFEGVGGLTAVLVTHQHADHLDVDRLRRLLDRNTGAVVVADEGTAGRLAAAGVGGQTEIRTARAGDGFDLAGVPVEVAGVDHAVIHPEIPMVPNVGYLVGGRFYYPGDAFTLPPGGTAEILGLPTAAPWSKISENIEFLRAVAPRVAVPLHDGLLSRKQVYYQHYGRFAEDVGATLTVADDGEPVDL